MAASAFGKLEDGGGFVFKQADIDGLISHLYELIYKGVIGGMWQIQGVPDCVAKCI